MGVTRVCACGCGEAVTSKHKHATYRQYHHTRSKNPGHTVDTATGCWLWNGFIRATGYPGYMADWTGKSRAAHRVYYERAKGPIPDGLHLDHLCRTRACVNPDHLEPVTISTNIRRAPRAKLTCGDRLAEIGRLLAAGWTQRAVAVHFSATQGAVHHLVRKGLVGCHTHRAQIQEAAERARQERATKVVAFGGVQ